MAGLTSITDYRQILQKSSKYVYSRNETKEEKQMAKDDRFEKVYSQGTMTITEIWVDKETGVNYVFHKSGYAGGITPLLDREGKPIITAVVNR